MQQEKKAEETKHALIPQIINDNHWWEKQVNMLLKSKHKINNQVIIFIFLGFNNQWLINETYN